MKYGLSSLAGVVFVAVLGGTFVFAEPSVENITLQPVVGQHQRQEIAFDIRGVDIVNPYDPSDIAVDAVFHPPSGRRTAVPGFFHVSDDPLAGSPARKSEWRVRLAPVEVGTYLVGIYLSMRGEERRRLATVSFQCTPSLDRNGFVSRHERQLCSSTGEFFFPIGGNRCWSVRGGAAGYLDDMRIQAENGINCMRVWLAPWWIQIESRPGVYDPVASALLDSIMDRAEELGMRVIVCIEQHGNLQPEGFEVGQWTQHPYNAVNGGPCKSRLEFFTSPAAKTLFKNRLRYLVARWGYSPAVLGWELFNEVEWANVEKGGYTRNRVAITGWHREMSGFLRAQDPFSHLIMTSSDLNLQKVLVKGDAVDLVTIHMYKDDALGPRLREVLMELRRDVDVPILVEEFGQIRDKADERRLVRGIFIAALGGSGAGAFPWLQDVESPAGFYKRISAATRFFDGVGWEREGFRPFESHVIVEINLANYGGAGETLPEPVHLVALRGATHILLFAFSGPERGPSPAPQWVRFRLQDVPPGRYRVEVWNPVFGNVIRQITAEADADGLLVEVAECPAEVSLKIEMPPKDAE